MENLTISKEHVLVPKLGLGTYQLQGKEGERTIGFAIANGYRHIDTAQFYCNEDVVGNAIWNSGVAREDFFITTKVWHTNFTKKRFIASVERSLHELGTDYVDLLLLHCPSFDEAKNKLAVELLAECQNKKYAKHIGVSNFNVSQLENARKQAPIICNQVEYNPYIDQSKMVHYTEKNNLLLTAYSPLAVGKVVKDDTLISLGEKYGKHPGQIALRWLIQQRNVSPIPKADNRKQIIENKEVFDFHLSKEDMEKIFHLSEQVN